MEFYNVFLLPSVTYRNSTYIVLLDDLSEAYVDRTWDESGKGLEKKSEEELQIYF